MATIFVTNDQDVVHAISAPCGYSVMEILRDYGVKAVKGTCGGSMACATCRVYVTTPDILAASDNDITEEEIDILQLHDNAAMDARLSCQICMSDVLDGLSLTIPKEIA